MPYGLYHIIRVYEVAVWEDVNGPSRHAVVVARKSLSTLHRGYLCSTQFGSTCVLDWSAILLGGESNNAARIPTPILVRYKGGHIPGPALLRSGAQPPQTAR